MLSPLPALTSNGITIDASNAGVIVDGSLAPAGANGLVMNADNCVVQGLTIQGFKRDGVMIMPGASGNTIGGNRSVGAGPNGQGNTIIANGGDGVEITGSGADNNAVWGNYIGVDLDGVTARGNTWSGVAIKNGARSNSVGEAAIGYGNVISGNHSNGVWIGGAGTNGNQVIGNRIGTRADGLAALPTGQSGVSIPDRAANNRIGGTTAGEGNLISGNHDFGIFISDLGTDGNHILGNLIGPDRTGNVAIGQGQGGIIIQNGASSNAVGDGTSAGRNVISGNTFDGVHLLGSTTVSNTVQGNFIGSNAGGTAALPNTLHGVELSAGANNNLVGGDRLSGEGNLLSGNLNHGLVITSFAHHNKIAGNIIGPDATGTYFLGNHPWGGVDISDGAYDNIVGGWNASEGNLISGNPTDGIALFQSNADPPVSNQLWSNVIGLTLNGDPLPNGGAGILNGFGAVETRIQENTVAHNAGYGIVVANCNGHALKQNSVYRNALGAIRNEGHCLPPPVIRVASVGDSDVLTGTTIPTGHVEIFSDDDGQARVYEGEAKADIQGYFSLSKPGGFAGPNLTATSRDAENTNNTSELSQPVHLAWTVLLYLNGDNDLELFMRDTISHTVAAGPSPQANVLALLDAYTTTVNSGTALYDLTAGHATVLPAMGGERNMGDKQTLIDFVTWGRDHYPSHRTLLAIVDHGGGWAPSTGDAVPGPLAPA
ncbi:MAG TPA: clostripain-related cysteine peptidase [Anaerolineae bacterium]|nr:clostripain-related cysteine peptidase [Anaerolineae bacterium]